jgi:hypothetical protein
MYGIRNVLGSFTELRKGKVTTSTDGTLQKGRQTLLQRVHLPDDAGKAAW